MHLKAQEQSQYVGVEWLVLLLLLLLLLLVVVVVVVVVLVSCSSTLSKVNEYLSSTDWVALTFSLYSVQFDWLAFFLFYTLVFHSLFPIVPHTHTRYTVLSEGNHQSAKAFSLLSSWLCWRPTSLPHVFSSSLIFYSSSYSFGYVTETNSTGGD